MKFTEKAIERLKADSTRDIGDDSTTGLYLRVTPAGRRTWRYRYSIKGRIHIITIGSWPDTGLAAARREAATLKARVANGEDPSADLQRAQAKKRAMPTVSEFVPEYMKRHAKPNKKSWKQDQQIIERWIEPRIGRLKMDDVSRRDIVAILDDVRDTGATRQPGKVLAVARMLFKVAIQRGILDATPCLYIEEAQPDAPQHAMTEEQVKHWWQSTGEAIESADPAIHKPTALALRLLLLTGQRPGEVANMVRDELHLESKFGPYWLIPGERRKKGRAKSGKPHAVALEPLAVKTIRRAMALSGSDNLFEAPAGGPIRTDTHMAKSLARVFDGQDNHPTGHWARHTVATELGEMGIDEYNIGRVLGHGSKTVTGTVYINRRINEPALRAQRKLLCAWENRLNEIVTGKKKSTVSKLEARA